MLPEIGKIYNCYDDGKIRDNRKYFVLITGIIPFDEISKEILEVWKQEIENSRVFNKKTDYFIISDSFEIEKEIHTQIFVRTFDQKWFGFNLEDNWMFNNGLLIIY